MIDYKDGKVVWDNSLNWEKEDSYYDYHQDILQLTFGKNCVIDVGNYGDLVREPYFTIKVIDFLPYPNDDDKPEAWRRPYATIPCQDKADMLIQLQRAIDVYPNMIG